MSAVGGSAGRSLAQNSDGVSWGSLSFDADSSTGGRHSRRRIDRQGSVDPARTIHTAALSTPRHSREVRHRDNDAPAQPDVLQVAIADELVGGRAANAEDLGGLFNGEREGLVGLHAHVDLRARPTSPASSTSPPRPPRPPRPTPGGRRRHQAVQREVEPVLPRRRQHPQVGPEVRVLGPAASRSRCTCSTVGGIDLPPTLRRRGGVDGRVAGDQAPPARLLQRLADDRVADPHRPARQPPSVQVAVELVEVDRPQRRHLPRPPAPAAGTCGPPTRRTRSSSARPSGASRRATGRAARRTSSAPPRRAGPRRPRRAAGDSSRSASRRVPRTVRSTYRRTPSASRPTKTLSRQLCLPSLLDVSSHGTPPRTRRPVGLPRDCQVEGETSAEVSPQACDLGLQRARRDSNPQPSDP